MESSEQSSHRVDEERFRRLIDVGSNLLSELDLEAVLKSVVEAARELTGARYAALGVLDREHRELERFINVGIDEATRREIGNLPRGRGVLGELIREPAPLRLPDVNAHPHAYGFPPGHPPMHSFLGVPIAVRGETYGNLYMTEKQGASEFDDGDQEAAVTLASWAGIAIENARLYTSLSEREAEVEQALRQAETSVDIARTVGGETDVARVLDLIVKRARALVDARALLVLLRRGEHLFVAARAGEVTAEVRDIEILLDDSVFGAVMEERVSQRLERGSPPSKARLRERLGAEAALVVPLLFRGRAVGALVALDREADGGVEFDQEDLRLLQSFAASAATAVATAQTVESDRLRQQVEVAEKERERWARELHDDALQGLAAIRINLATALQSEAEDRGERIERAAEGTLESLEEQINDLNRLINDLRPAALERLGLGGALQALAEECSARAEVEVDARIEIAPGNGEEPSRDEERIVYRLVQEALTNVARHARASRVRIEVVAAPDTVGITVADDGHGFDPAATTAGFGLQGMRERVALAGGTIDVDSGPQGTTLK
ncbi:MAG TPA: GAF domain-containing sensor histidine kinase, partial [Solirubrobacterales bacterium]|nr:GAF domain-containing sensor histidine kinase [Solirubrobacterales bacterium]